MDINSITFSFTFLFGLMLGWIAAQMWIETESK